MLIGWAFRADFWTPAAQPGLQRNLEEPAINNFRPHTSSRPLPLARRIAGRGLAY